MSCTTLLVGKKASIDGSTLMARDDDTGSGKFDPKKFVVIEPKDQPRLYKAVLSKIEIELPDNPLRYTSLPDAVNTIGIWGEAGVNEENVAMTETETITSNYRIDGADPLVENGIGEEDLLTIVLPYIHTAREGVIRLGSLLEKYGTYERNGIGFQDKDEIWWLESIGGHHWIAKRVPDDCYAVVPNQFGIDYFDLKDAFDQQKENMCSADLIEFIEKYHLNAAMEETNLKEETQFDARGAFGSHSDSDYCYNTPRAWYIERYLNPNTFIWDGQYCDYSPVSDDLPWCLQPEKKISVEEVKYALSSYYQGTPYNPYLHHGDKSLSGMYRPIGINRNTVLAVTQIRPDMPKEISAIEWIAIASNAFNAIVPFYANITTTPDYLSNTSLRVSTDNFYWSNRLIGALADAHYNTTIAWIERYQNKVMGTGLKMIYDFDAYYLSHDGLDNSYFNECNQKIADFVKKETDDLLDKVLFIASSEMKNAYSREDN